VGAFVIFVDSSAIVAILTADPDATALAGRLESDPERISAGHVILEASMRLASLFGLTPSAADGLVTRLLREAAIAVVPITEDIGHVAVAAFDRYGRGRGTGGNLNFGDCLSYACAKAHDARLLFKGHDFAQTDVAPA
jgi:ribonuclease VapC